MHPDVYIEELPGGLQTITGVATSIAALRDDRSSGGKAAEVLP